MITENLIFHFGTSKEKLMSNLCILKQKRIIGFCLFFLTYFCCFLYGADLDNLYQTILEKDRFLCSGNFYYFELKEKGIHGSDNYDKFDSTPYIYSFENLLKFSPLSSSNITFGFNEMFPVSYTRLTYNPLGSLDSIQKYELDYFQDYTINFQFRKNPIDIYMDMLEKRQQSNWNWASNPDPPNYFSYIKSHYENFKVGGRYLSKCNEPCQSKLSKITRPLICEDQINIETELEYKTGALRRTTDYTLSGIYNYNFFHRLKPHLISKLILRYGLNENLELESGLSYTTPFKYRYEYTSYNPDNTYSYIIGQYKLKHNFYLPFVLRYRFNDILEVTFSSDFHYISQRLDYWQKATNDTLIRYPFKKLTYYNVQPSLNLTYLYDNGKDIEKDKFSSLTKTLLLKNQFLMELQCQKDITHLDKNSDNGTQNLIDPYNIFLYPLDYFVVGSEYATFFTGNYSRYATNILPQNYYYLEAGFKYGLFNNVNIDMKLGYRSESLLKHFTLPDLNSRAYRFKPYYFSDFLCDWRLTQNSLLSLKTHFVPEYTTYMDCEGYPKEFNSKTEYFGITASLKILF